MSQPCFAQIAAATPIASLLGMNLPVMISAIPYAGHEWHTIATLQREGKLIEILPSSNFADLAVAELGKEDLAYATPLATYAVAQYRAGRRVGNRLNVREVLSEHAQQRKRFTVESLDRFDEEENQWREAVVEDTRTSPVPDVVAFRCDFSQWLHDLPHRNRRITVVGFVSRVAN